MARHLVITVHGIGEQQPGETVDAVVGAATTGFPGRPRQPVEVERDVIELAETRFGPEPRNAALFPVHLRRVRRTHVQSRDDDVVFAEVYWADRSPAPKGAVRTIIDLLKVVLGLGYLAMDNVENNRGFGPVALVHLFTWVFYGLIAPLNAILLMGAVLLLIDMSSFKIGTDIPELAVIFVDGALALAIGLMIWLHFARTYLVRIFGRGLSALGVIILIVAIAGDLGAAFPWSMCTEPQRPPDPYHPILECYVGLNIGLLGFSWFTTVTLALLTYPAALLPQKASPQDGVTGHRAIFPSIAGAMVMFWMVFSSAFWLTFVNMAGRISPTTGEAGETLLQAIASRRLPEALGTLGVTAGSLAILVLVGIHLVIARRLAREELYTRPETISRVILNSRLQMVFGLSLVLIWLAVVHLLNERVSGFRWIDARPFSWVTPVFDWLSTKDGVVAAVILGIGLLIYNFSHLVAGGLGIIRDIVTYSVRDHCHWRSEHAIRARNFVERRQINNRFKRVLEYGLETVRPEKVTVISHSQGTVIATQMLQDRNVKAQLAKHGAPPVLLITMGSPVTHIYRRYFKEFFQVSLAEMPPGTTWFNIHRADDFVGTRIEDALADEDHNLSVPAGGHTGYFTDFHVWNRLWNDVRFQLFI